VILLLHIQKVGGKQRSQKSISKLLHIVQLLKFIYTNLNNKLQYIIMKSTPFHSNGYTVCSMYNESFLHRSKTKSNLKLLQQPVSLVYFCMRAHVYNKSIISIQRKRGRKAFFMLYICTHTHTHTHTHMKLTSYRRFIG
jgi:hypothetical protein